MRAIRIEHEMNAKQINMALWTGATGVLMAAVITLLAAFLWPIEHPPTLESAAIPSTTRPATSPSIPELSAFEKIWRTPLRQPLGEALPNSSSPPLAVKTTEPNVNPVTPMSAGVPVSLVGTIGNSLAMLKTMSNAVEVCAVGESLSGVTVVAVRTAEVDVRFNGQVIKLSKPAEPQLH